MTSRTELLQYALAVALLSGVLTGQDQPAPHVLPAVGTAQLAKSLKAAAAHPHHIWRDTPPMNADGSVNGYVEISRGDRRKWEFDIAANTRTIDRVMPERIGGYPVNYGFVPQTISYDGDPFDVLVLGPPLPGGELVRGTIVGLLHMEDDKGLDSKVVISPVDDNGRPRYGLTQEARAAIAGYFKTYRSWEPGKFSRVPGWGSTEEGRTFVAATHQFFLSCRGLAAEPCRI